MFFSAFHMDYSIDSKRNLRATGRNIATPNFWYVLHPEQDAEAMPGSLGSLMHRESKVPYDDI